MTKTSRSHRLKELWGRKIKRSKNSLARLRTWRWRTEVSIMIWNSWKTTNIKCSIKGPTRSVTTLRLTTQTHPLENTCSHTSRTTRALKTTYSQQSILKFKSKWTLPQLSRTALALALTRNRIQISCISTSRFLSTRLSRLTSRTLTLGKGQTPSLNRGPPLSKWIGLTKTSWLQKSTKICSSNSILFRKKRLKLRLSSKTTTTLL